LFHTEEPALLGAVFDVNKNLEKVGDQPTLRGIQQPLAQSEGRWPPTGRSVHDEHPRPEAGWFRPACSGSWSGSRPLRRLAAHLAWTSSDPTAGGQRVEGLTRRTSCSPDGGSPPDWEQPLLGFGSPDVGGWLASAPTGLRLGWRPCLRKEARRCRCLRMEAAPGDLRVTRGLRIATGGARVSMR
jgi:hypothetical protein